MDIELEGFQLLLLAERGVYVPAHNALLVADTHFGKDATFRGSSLPVPRGTNEGTLAAIDRMLRETSARRLIFLGDFFHASSSMSSAVMQPLDDFFQSHADIACGLTLGNHDRKLGVLPTAWHLEVASELSIGDLACAHFPRDLRDDEQLLLCGHLHPAVRLLGWEGRSEKLPCFWWTNRNLILPALGQFTGTRTVTMQLGDRAWVAADAHVIEVHRRSTLRAPSNS